MPHHAPAGYRCPFCVYVAGGEDDLVQRATRRAAIAVRAAFDAEGTSTQQHNEPAGNQDVWHFHTHVFPRHRGDDLYRSPSRWPSGAEMERRAETLREAYGALDGDAGASV
jgi:diadenosine tetraphosphate (Ap4A) HIT family hydrolase